MNMNEKNFRMKILILSTFIFSNILVSESKHRLKNIEFGPKIVGGKSVALEKYPYAIQFFNLGALCGGVILNSWSILTSAHCLENNQDIDEMRVQIGSKYIYDFNAKKHEVASFVVHEKYNKKIPFENDIALVFVRDPMKFNKLAKKAVLVDHDRWMSSTARQFTVTGWGWQKYGGSLSEMSLMMTSLTYVPVQECSRLHQIELSKDMFCLYGNGKRDTCRGDSGGGVLWHGKIVGLTSHGDGCAKKDKPSVYTNVFYQRSWIKKQVLKFIDNYCGRRNKVHLLGKIVTLNNNTVWHSY